MDDKKLKEYKARKSAYTTLYSNLNKKNIYFGSDSWGLSEGRVCIKVHDDVIDNLTSDKCQALEDLMTEFATKLVELLDG